MKYHKWHNNHIIIQIREEKDGDEGAGPLRQLLQKAKVQECSSWRLLPPWPSSLPYAHFLGLLLVCILMMVTFSSLNLYILHLYRKMLLKASFTPEL